MQDFWTINSSSTTQPICFFGIFGAGEDSGWKHPGSTFHQDDDPNMTRKSKADFTFCKSSWKGKLVCTSYDFNGFSWQGTFNPRASRSTWLASGVSIQNHVSPTFTTSLLFCISRHTCSTGKPLISTHHHDILEICGMFLYVYTDQKNKTQHTSTSWWCQPLWKIIVKLEIFPK